MMKLTVVVTLVLLAFVKIGSSLNCYKCSGDLEKCNSQYKTEQTCEDGHTRCASLVTNSADGMHFTYGCAKPLDCKAASSVCAEMMKTNPQTTCNATCCTGNNCVAPYAKDYSPKQCYECTSMEDCETAKLKVCDNEDDYCFKISTEVTHQDSNVMLNTYSKGCATKSQCDNKEAQLFYQTCAADSDSACDMNCCADNMCNAGSNVVVSAFMLFACALFAVVRL